MHGRFVGRQTVKRETITPDGRRINDNIFPVEMGRRNIGDVQRWDIGRMDFYIDQVTDCQKMNNRDPITIVFISGFFAVVALVSLVVFWLFFDANPPAVVNDVYSHVDVAVPGQTIPVTIDWCKYTTETGIVNITWINDLVYPQTPFDPVVSTVGCRITNMSFLVPVNLPPAEYTVMGEVVYHVNPFKTRYVYFSFGPINVIDSLEP